VKRLTLLLTLAAALLAPAQAAAHPLGNFTVNRFTAIELSGSDIYVKQVLDLAEIPAFQEGDRVRAGSFGRELARDLHLEVDGRRVALTLLDSEVTARPGAGGLPTLRFEAVYEAAASGETLRFRDTSFGRRVGWREIVVRANRGARVESATAPARSRSDELRAYPQELLSEPLDVRTAVASVELGAGPGTSPPLGRRAAEPRAEGRFESLIAQDDLGLGVIVVSLLIAAFWGAAHALTPGHGKAIVAGYLVGTRGRPRHAVALGLIVTVTHTAGVFALGLVTLLLSELIVPEQLYPWLTLASGLLVVAVGASVLWARLRHRRLHAHGHHHHHEHGHDHDHGFGRGGLLGVGIAAGLLPCPSALVVLLSAIALHRIGLGLALIVAFSVGLAATITAIGLVAVLARRAFGRLRLDGPFVRAVPAVSALVVLAVGIGITVNSLPEVF
jgi:nickel/cobalt transporter (NicO) family protein